jgi:hypothetical protein
VQSLEDCLRVAQRCSDAKSKEIEKAFTQ